MMFVVNKHFSEYSFLLVVTGIIPIPSQRFMIPNSGLERIPLEQEIRPEDNVELEHPVPEQRKCSLSTEGSNGKRKDPIQHHMAEIEENKRNKITSDSNSAALSLPSVVSVNGSGFLDESPL